MQLGLLASSLILAVMSLAAHAAADDCFPACAPPAQVEVKADATLDAPPAVTSRRESAGATPATRPCAAAFMQQADELNDKIKPLKEIAGYVRSPQALAIKLVNDHLVKIPEWVGYAIDPLGSIRNRVIDEVRTQARKAVDDGIRCVPPPAAAGEDDNAAAAIDAKHSI